jgi:hypothetical protein
LQKRWRAKLVTQKAAEFQYFYAVSEVDTEAELVERLQQEAVFKHISVLV